MPPIRKYSSLHRQHTQLKKMGKTNPEHTHSLSKVHCEKVHCEKAKIKPLELPIPRYPPTDWKPGDGDQILNQALIDRLGPFPHTIKGSQCCLDILAGNIINYVRSPRLLLAEKNIAQMLNKTVSEVIQPSEDSKHPTSSTTPTTIPTYTPTTIPTTSKHHVERVTDNLGPRSFSTNTLKSRW